MNIEKLLDALGNIHPKYIKEAEDQGIRALRMRRKQRLRQLGLLASAAACVGIVVLAAQMGLFSPRGAMEAAPEETAGEFTEEAVEEAAPEESSGMTEELQTEEAATEEMEESPAEERPIEDLAEEEAAPAEGKPKEEAVAEDSGLQVIRGAAGEILWVILDAVTVK